MTCRITFLKPQNIMQICKHYKKKMLHLRESTELAMAKQMKAEEDRESVRYKKFHNCRLRAYPAYFNCCKEKETKRYRMVLGLQYLYNQKGLLDEASTYIHMCTHELV